MILSWIPLFYSVLQSQAYKSTAYVAAGSWCEILSQTEVLKSLTRIYIEFNVKKIVSDPDSEGCYSIDAVLANLHNKHYATARFVVPSKLPLHNVSAYRAHWNSSAQIYCVAKISSGVYQPNSSEVLPVNATLELEDSTSSRVEEAVTQTVNASKSDCSSSPISTNSQPGVMSTNWADMVDEDLEEMDRAAMHSSISDPSDDEDLKPTIPVAENSKLLPSPIGHNNELVSLLDTLDLAKPNRNRLFSDEWQDRSQLLHLHLVKSLDLQMYSLSYEVWDRYVLGLPLRRSVQDPRTCCLNYLCAGAINILNNEIEPQYIHHFNFVNDPVWRKSLTPPAVSLWACMSEGLKDKRFLIGPNLKYVLASQAGKYIDPFCFDRSMDELDDLRNALKGSALQDAATGYTQKAYHHLGNWVHDRYDPDDDVPLFLHETSFVCSVKENVNQPVPIYPMSALENRAEEYIVRKNDETSKPKVLHGKRLVTERKSNLRHVRNIYDDDVFSQYEDLSDIPEVRPSFPEFFFGSFAISVGRKALGLLNMR